MHWQTEACAPFAEMKSLGRRVGTPVRIQHGSGRAGLHRGSGSGLWIFAEGANGPLGTAVPARPRRERLRGPSRAARELSVAPLHPFQRGVGAPRVPHASLPHTPSPKHHQPNDRRAEEQRNACALPDLPVIGGGQLRHFCRNLLRGARGVGVDGRTKFPNDADTRTDRRGGRGRAPGSTSCDEECRAREP